MSFLSRALHRLDERAFTQKPPWGGAYLRFRNATSGNSFEDFGQGNLLTFKDCRVELSSFTVMGSNNRVEIDGRSRLRKIRLTICGSNCLIRIGKNVLMDDVFVWITDNDSEITIGDGSFAQESQIVATDKGCRLNIGADCMIAFGSDVRCGDGHAVYNVATGEILNRASFITIEDHVWLASESKVLKDVRIGKGSVVAARSVVTRDIPANSLAVGIPARVVRSGINWRRENIDRLPKDWFVKTETPVTP